MFSRRFIKRSGTVALILLGAQITGGSVIQDYKPLRLDSKEESSFNKQVLWDDGSYRADYLFSLCCRQMVSCSYHVYWPCNAGPPSYHPHTAVKFYSNNSNINSRAGIAFISIYSVTTAIFLNGMVYVLVSELHPIHVRGYDTSLATSSTSCAQILLTQVTPLAFAVMKWKYYFIFLVYGSFMVVFYIFCLPETRGKTLEEIGETFGYTVVSRETKQTIAKQEGVQHAQAELVGHVEA